MRSVTTTSACREVEALLIEVADEALDPAAEAGVGVHLAACPSCRAKADFWRAAVPAMTDRRAR